MTEAQDRLLAAIAGTTLPLLHTMDMGAWLRQRLDPFALPDLTAAIRQTAGPLADSLPAFRAADWPEGLDGFRSATETAASGMLEMFAGLDQAARAEGFDGLRIARRALKGHLEAERALYPLWRLSPPISQYYLPHEQREDAALLAVLDRAAEAPPGHGGVTHVDGSAGDRHGGYSLYIPEYMDASVPAPVVLALHGGRGSGPDFLWSWLPAARAAGAVLIAPTALGETWSIMGEDIDSPNIERILREVAARQELDRDRILLTGMSDGGTFAYVSGLGDASPATALAPFSASFHPMLLEFVSPARLAALPIRLTHGVRDWMFQIDVARSAAEAFRRRNARLTCRELPDRAHVFPQDEAAPTLDWFLNGGRDDAP